MKKHLTTILLILSACLACILLASCSKEPPIAIGENGNWIIDGTDSGIKAQPTDGVDGENGLDGENGTVVSIGENGNWYLDGVDTGIVAVPKKYVVDVKTSVIYDSTTGKRMIETLLIYQDGTHCTSRSEIPAAISSVSLRQSKFLTGFEPLLQVRVDYDDGTYRYVSVKDDMWISQKPDFNAVGTYDVELLVMGKNLKATVTVVDGGASYSTYCEGIEPIPLDTPANEVGVLISFYTGSERITYSIPLPSCNTSYLDTVFDTVGEVSISFTYREKTHGVITNVYHPTLYNIQEVKVPTYIPTAAQNDTEGFDEAIDKLLERTVTVYFFEGVNGHLSAELPITRDMMDLSEVDISKPGVYPIKLTVTVEGQGTAVSYVYVQINAEVKEEEILGVYECDGPGSVTMAYGDLTLLSDTVAEVHEGQFTYTRDGNIITLYDYFELTIHLLLDTENMTFAPYMPEGTPERTYTADGTSIHVFKDYVVVCDENGTAVYSMDNQIVNNEMAWMRGTKIILNDDGTFSFN